MLKIRETTFQEELDLLIQLNRNGVMDYDTLETQRSIVVDMFNQASSVVTPPTVTFSSVKELEETIRDLSPEALMLLGYTEKDGTICRWHPQMDKHGHLIISGVSNEGN